MSYAKNLSDLQGDNNRVYIYLNPKIAKKFFANITAYEEPDVDGLETLGIYGILEEVRDSGVLFNRIYRLKNSGPFEKDFKAYKSGELHEDDLSLEPMFLPWSSIIAIV
jgi:hypothetical protein